MDSVGKIFAYHRLRFRDLLIWGFCLRECTRVKERSSRGRASPKSLRTRAVPSTPVLIPRSPKGAVPFSSNQSRCREPHPLLSNQNRGGHHLSLDYYKKTCPQFESTVRDAVFAKQSSVPATAPGVLRLFFHDCLIDGCDASILVSSNGYARGERDAVPNLSLSGDAFEIINKIKNSLELTCPGVVSCSDIMAEATRDLVKMVGGPYYKVLLGRKDSLVTNITKAAESLPEPEMPMDRIITKFTSRGFNIREMVALTGAHTIGFTHCNQFSHRIFNFSATSDVDPTLNPKLAAGLKRLCQNYTTDNGMSAFNDVRSPSKFDNAYFQNILRGLGLLTSDHALSVDPRTRPIVEIYARNQTAFFVDFAAAMEKVSVLNVKTGRKGEIRDRCDQFNHIPM
ncbi:peroxidase 65-like [Senna tora]|uniref:Peroxidase n=1 Tax=Senna tora TaxID=362788 RepID=A0A834SYN0_9FABA|nr:peroxidase 65-like [Senna tora]